MLSLLLAASRENLPRGIKGRERLLKASIVRGKDGVGTGGAVQQLIQARELRAGKGI